MKLEFGCGAHKPAIGFCGVDVRRYEHVKYVCNAWDIDNFVSHSSVEEIYARHFFEHLTFIQGDKTLQVWRNILVPNGKLHLIIPDMLYHIEQYIDCERQLSSEANKSWSRVEHAEAAFWGWQREGETEVWDIHKSGYDFSRLKEKLESNGFGSIKRLDDKPWNLNVECRSI